MGPYRKWGIRIMHIENNYYECLECDESFDSQEQLDEHNRTNGEYKED
jgi:hypothetical protein